MEYTLFIEEKLPWLFVLIDNELHITLCPAGGQYCLRGMPGRMKYAYTHSSSSLSSFENIIGSTSYSL